MARFELEDLPPKPQEGMMQKAEQEQLKTGEVKGSGVGTGGSQPQGSGTAEDSAFYPAIETIRIALLKKLKYELPNQENRNSLRIKMVAVERQLGGSKFIDPKWQAVGLFSQPFVEGWIVNFDAEKVKIDSKWLKKGKKEEKKDEPSDQGADQPKDDSPPVTVTYGNPKDNNVKQSQATELGKSAQQKVI